MAKILKTALIGTLTFSVHRSFEFAGEETEITVAGGHAVSIHKSSSWRILAAGKPAN